MATMTRVDSGLDGVVVADTTLSLVDGEAGRLVIRGRELADVVRAYGSRARRRSCGTGSCPKGDGRRRCRPASPKVAWWRGRPSRRGSKRRAG